MWQIQKFTMTTKKSHRGAMGFETACCEMDVWSDIASRLMYAAIIWENIATLKTAKKQLETLRELTVKGITEKVRTTPTPALGYVTGIESLYIGMRAVTVNTLIIIKEDFKKERAWIGTRWRFVKNTKLCYMLCLEAGHSRKDCDEESCGKCEHKHRSMLHFNDKNEQHCRKKIKLNTQIIRMQINCRICKRINLIRRAYD